MVKKTDKPVEKPLLPPVVVESDNGELPAEIAPEVTEESAVVETPAASTPADEPKRVVFRHPDTKSVLDQLFPFSSTPRKTGTESDGKNNLQPPSSRTILARITTDRTTRIIITTSATTIITMLCRKNSMSLTVY